MSIIIEDKVSVVTGGARGIGLAIAKTFLNARAKVAVCDRNEGELARAAEALSAQYGDSFNAIASDISIEDDVKNLITEVIGKFGAIDIVVNNAGISGMSRVWETPVEEWDAVISTNLRGTFLCTREAVRAMLLQGTGGKIINIASINSLLPTTGIAAYCASKGGLLMFTRAAAVELGPYGININAIAPGSTVTPLTEWFLNLPGLKEAFVDRTPMGRFGQPEDIAKVALFLASDYGAWISGQIIHVDGGQCLMGLPRYYEGLQEAPV